MCAAILRYKTSDVSQIVYVTDALLAKAMIGGASRKIVIVTYANRDVLDTSNTIGQM